MEEKLINLKKGMNPFRLSKAEITVLSEELTKEISENEESLNKMKKIIKEEKNKIKSLKIN